MESNIDETHNPEQLSWVESANIPETDFPIQNLPFGVFRTRDDNQTTHVGIAIGDQIFDVVKGLETGVFRDKGAKGAEACRSGRLNELMALDRSYWKCLRKQTWDALRKGSDKQNYAELALIPMNRVEMTLPTNVQNFSDFSFSIVHNQTLGEVAKKEKPLHANFGYLPTGYHARASSIRVSGTPVKRPKGQLGDRQATTPMFGPCKRLDYEMELAIYVGPGNQLGHPIPLDRAEDHIFGIGLLNDWTARDIQSWEITPLGPFLSKSHLTSVSPWVVTLEALAPFRTKPASLKDDNRKLFNYLISDADRKRGALNILARAEISSREMREKNVAPFCTSLSSAGKQYWTIFQLLAHQTINGCNILPGDILGSGTISHDGENSRGCLQEKTFGGKNPFELPTGESRTFLEDGDEVNFTASCERDGFRRIGFGNCIGRVDSADIDINASAMAESET